MLACLEAGADAAGCTMDHEWQDPAYADMLDNPVLVDLLRGQRRAHRPRTWPTPANAAGVVGSTDMGNVSYVVPSIHPMIGRRPAGISIHTPEFTRLRPGRGRRPGRARRRQGHGHDRRRPLAATRAASTAAQGRRSTEAVAAVGP